VPLSDPWYDYLALPIAPLVLLVQLGALLIWKTWLRWGLSIACATAITAMFLYVASLPVGETEGVNIGAGVMLLWLLVSLVLVVILVIRDVVVIAIRGVLRARQNPTPSK
jgi:cytochrome c biogenesis factor